MAEERKKIGEMLLDAGIITKEQLDNVLEIQKNEKDKKLGELLVSQGIIDKKTLMEYVLTQIK
jgi:type IV pilus assembly protein PilB